MLPTRALQNICRSDAIMNTMKIFSCTAEIKSKSLENGEIPTRRIITIVFPVGDVGDTGERANFYQIQPIAGVAESFCSRTILKVM
jgi:hypothetical protein